MVHWLLVLSLASPATRAGDCGTDPGAVGRVRDERVTGSLALAEAEARRLLECPDLDSATRLGLYIELARVLDRVGLHHNTRPVKESLETLRRAEAAVRDDDTVGRAKIELALADYFYRAEMNERRFTTATGHARRAARLFRQLDDPIGETDAVHRLGLIALQKGDLDEARKLFDRSLELSRAAPDRPIFLSDYHRHVGFVDLFTGDQAAAVARFERSLAYRDEAGSRDYGLFARTELGSALVDAGRAREAGPYLDEALRIARELPSPVGELRATYALGKMHEALGETGEAREAYRRAEERAAGLGAKGLEKAAGEARARLGAPTEGKPSK